MFFSLNTYIIWFDVDISQGMHWRLLVGAFESFAIAVGERWKFLYKSAPNSKFTLFSIFSGRDRFWEPSTYINVSCETKTLSELAYSYFQRFVHSWHINVFILVLWFSIVHESAPFFAFEIFIYNYVYSDRFEHRCDKRISYSYTEPLIW